jgi:formylglycine-generating enzyme required for sulfatase activity
MGQEEQLGREPEGKPGADAQKHRRLPWATRRSTLLLGFLAGVVALCAIAAWLASSPAPKQVALTAAQERALKPGDTFRECTNCPVMKVVPAGSFVMGSPADEPNRFGNEDPQHEVTIASRFAVGEYELRFDEWDACVADGGCNAYKPPDLGWGRKDRPVINVSWVDARVYVSWLAKKTGKPYRLLTESEYEYAARAGTQAAYPWGDDIGTNRANCAGCGSPWNGKETAPVGSFPANGFGLFDMVGNVWEWTQDCFHDSYTGAPADGSAWTSGDCQQRVLRGGSWINSQKGVRSALRDWLTPDRRINLFGFRVGRTLLAP